MKDQDVVSCMRPCFKGDVKNRHIHGGSGVGGGEATPKAVGRRYKSPTASIRLIKK